MARFNINTYNQQIDNTKTIMRLGRNGVLYEYVMPLKSDPYNFYEEAIDVKSHKSATTKYQNGKKPGQYQLIGDKSYFTFYQLKNVDKEIYHKTLSIYMVKD